MAAVFFHAGPVRSWEESGQCDTEKFARYFRYLLAAGIHMPAAQFEAYFHSAAHADRDIERTAGVMCEALDAAHQA